QVEAVGASVSRENKPQVGYLAPEEQPGIVAIREMVFTPIIDQVGHQTLGVLGVGFPLPTANSSNSISSAIWLDNRLYSSSIPADVLNGVEQAVGTELRTRAVPHREFAMRAGNTLYQVYCEALDPGPAFPPAYQVCLYSL